MKNSTLILVMVAAAFGAANTATAFGYREGKEITLAPLETPSTKEVMSCGRYFYRTTEGSFPEGPLVTLKVEKDGVGMLSLIRKNQLRLVINPSKKSPTITFVPRLPRLQNEDDPAPYYWIVQMNGPEARMARPCFHHPIRDPRTI
jgi:hypothetical protein